MNFIMKYVLPIVALSVLLLPIIILGWDNHPEHAEWQKQCVASHNESKVVMVPMAYDDETTMIPQTRTNTVCDKYEPLCVPGKDGSTVCK